MNRNHESCKPQISQRAAAELLGTTESHFCRVLRGERRSQRLSRALNQLRRSYRIVYYTRQLKEKTPSRRIHEKTRSKESVRNQ